MKGVKDVTFEKDNQSLIQAINSEEDNLSGVNLLANDCRKLGENIPRSRDRSVTETMMVAAAEISEASPPQQPHPSPLLRTRPPGLKRLRLTSSILFSFLFASPFLFKSVEIFRSRLPFHSIDSLSPHSVFFPCSFHVVFLRFPSPNSSVDHLHVAISDEIRKLTHGSASFCGACTSNFTLSVTFDPHLYRFRSELALFDDLDDDTADQMFDELLAGNYKGYTVVVVKSRGKDTRAVVGRRRHAWIRVAEGKQTEVVPLVAALFVKVFSNGGTGDGIIQEENVPVGPDGRLVLSFSLLNSDPVDWAYRWDFQRVSDIILNPLSEALVSVADISVESQVLYHAPMSSSSLQWDARHGCFVFPMKDLPFFVNSNEWNLDTSVATGGRSKVLHFVVYVPSARECPLFLQFPDGSLSVTNGFISPMWGGVVVWNPPECGMAADRRPPHPAVDTISDEGLHQIFDVFVGQMRQLLGMNTESHFTDDNVKALISPHGFTEWELDFLARQHTCFNIMSCSNTLGSLARLVKSLPRMIVVDEIGRRVNASLSGARLALANASNGEFLSAAVASRAARSQAEDAFFHPSVMSVSYYSFEHCFAIYSPFFMPVLAHVVLASLKECRRYRREQLMFSRKEKT